MFDHCTQPAPDPVQVCRHRVELPDLDSQLPSVQALHRLPGERSVNNEKSTLELCGVVLAHRDWVTMATSWT
jgi:hypothetical protein